MSPKLLYTSTKKDFGKAAVLFSADIFIYEKNRKRKLLLEINNIIISNGYDYVSVMCASEKMSLDVIKSV